MFVRDISFLARLVNGRLRKDRAVHALRTLSPILRPVAKRLLTASPQERRPIWDDFLAGRLRPELVADVAHGPGLPAATTLDESQAPANEAAPLGPRQPFRTAPGHTRRARMTCAVDMKPLAVDWLWSGRVPLGMITMFAGDPKLGKSYVSLAMAAALSRGLPLPMSDRPDRVGSTILMSAEDDPARIIVPRLVAGGADLTKIHILESVILADGSETLPSLRADIDAITDAATKLGDCQLIVIDPVSAYLSGVDDNRNAALRGVLTPLNGLAERLGAAVVLVSHLTKAVLANGKHRVLGSIAYVGACRANHLFVADPNDPTGRRVLMLDNGGNVAEPAPALAYTIENRDSGPRIAWYPKPVAIEVVNVVRAAPVSVLQEEHAGGRFDCDDWLRTFLAEGHRSTIDIFEAATAAGYSKDQVRRAKRRIGAVARRHGFGGAGQWTWELEIHGSIL